jgi:hypothetical protein
MNLIGDAGLNEIARALGSGSAPSPAPTDSLWAKSGQTISPGSGVTEVLCNRVGTSTRKIYNTTLIGTTDVPSVGDFSTDDFELVGGKIKTKGGSGGPTLSGQFETFGTTETWYARRDRWVLPLNQAGTSNVWDVVGIEMMRVWASGSVLLIDFLVPTGYSLSNQHNIKYQIGCTNEQSGALTYNFVYSGSAWVLDGTIAGFDSVTFEASRIIVSMSPMYSYNIDLSQPVTVGIFCAGVEIGSGPKPDLSALEIFNRYFSKTDFEIDPNNGRIRKFSIN